ncbi:MAG: virulence RhuM family protein [Rhodocyclaceae bacterium]|jgi:hypothetical protein|nr:virulence RhuM family protein [Rhodocyclaceae bacterium]
MTTFAPKTYQQQVLDSVEAYFKACHELPSPSIAFTATAERLWGRGNAYNPLAGFPPDMPYFCLRVPTGGGSASVEMRYEDENLWLTQKMMATLYDVSVPAISQHLKRIYADNELTREATVKQYLMVQTEGDREVQRKVDHYSLQAIIAIGFKIGNERAVQFRKWASQIVKDYTIQGWVMDADRLKSGGSVLTKDFFGKR